MADARLTLALADSQISLPLTGQIAVLRASPENDYSALPRDRVVMINGFKPQNDALAAAGYTVADQLQGPVAATLVEITRSKAETLGLIAAAFGATQPGGLVLVDGAKTNGVESVLKHCRAVCDVTDVLAKSHG